MENIQNALDELNSLEGLEGVKAKIGSLVGQLNHMIFLGNPDTAQTTVARLVGQIYRELGILSSGHLVEVSCDDLVSQYVGQTAIKTKEVVEKAIGGVLLIDDVYSLLEEYPTFFGSEALESLLREMENTTDLVVILSGCKDKMTTFLDSNPGLSSHFSLSHIEF